MGYWCNDFKQDDWCDDFEIKAGDNLPVVLDSENQAVTTPEPPLSNEKSTTDMTKNDNTNSNIWLSNPLCIDPWLTDPKVRFAPIVPTEQNYPHPSDDTGDPLDYVSPETSDVSPETSDVSCGIGYHHSGVSDRAFEQSLQFSVASQPGYCDNDVLYLNVLHIFKYVTLGGMISDEHIDGFCKYVYDSDSDFKNRKTCKNTYVSVNGNEFDRYMVMYNRKDYLKLSVLCANWAQCNPEKVIMG